MYQGTTHRIAGRRNPLVSEIHAAFESSSTAVSADGANAHSIVALTALPEYASQP
jgi:hypothetical protein